MKGELKGGGLPWLPSAPARWRLLALCALLLALEWAGGEAGRELLRYERGAVADGQWWRLVSGHLVHLGWRHLALNLAGLLLMAALFADTFGPGRWVLIVFSAMAAIDLGFYFLEPQLQWYVGASGVLHGVLAAGALARVRGEAAGAGWLLGAVLIAKLLWELWRGPVPGSAVMSGGAVIVEAHLYGALGGVLAACALSRPDRPSSTLSL